MTEPEMIGERTPAPPREVSVAALAWAGLGTVFIAMRLAGLLNVPIAGVELDHLSGAWQVHAGNEDPRFVPTLFQGLAAWSFEFTSSEMPMRWLSLLASATIPLALYRLRTFLGEPAALAAVFLLAFDPAAILLGSTAWAGAFDIAAVLWLLVLSHGINAGRYASGAAGFVGATAGPLLLPVVIAIAAIGLARQDYPKLQTLVASGIGVAVGLLMASFGFGFGWEGPTIPPLEVFAEGFEATWSTESTRALAVLYSGPLVLLACAAALWRSYMSWSEQDWPETTVLLLSTFVISLAWLVLSGGSENPVPLAAVGLTGSLVLGREIPPALNKLRTVDWRYAGPALAGLFAAVLIAEAYAVDWARIDRVGDNRDKLIVIGLVIATLASVGILASSRRTAAALFVAVGVVALIPTLAGAFLVAFGAPNEPLPSPVSSVQGREMRDIALDARDRAGGGLIVIHADLGEAITWPFRDSGEIVLASRVPPDATVVIWPVTEPAPEGYAVVEGQWSFLQRRNGPDGDFLGYLRWFTNRNVLKNTIEPVAVYLRTTK